MIVFLSSSQRGKLVFVTARYKETTIHVSMFHFFVRGSLSKLIDKRDLHAICHLLIRGVHS